MPRQRKYRIFAADFETTVYTGQKSTEVWAAAIVELDTEDVKICGGIDKFFRHLLSLNTNAKVYFHNLKFDGTFILNYLIRSKYKDYVGSSGFVNLKDLARRSFCYNISHKGMWYSISVKLANGYLIEFLDSLKLMPFTLKAIGKSFKTKHQKLSMNYKGERYAYCPRTKEEDEYIRNDVLVLKEALEFMFSQGHDRMTIGSCCYAEFKQMYPKLVFERMFPNLYEIEIDEAIFGKPNAGEYINKSYKGGWCYAVPEKCGVVQRNGLTLDVNSLYPSVMHSDSGSYYPIGEPIFVKGDKDLDFHLRFPTSYVFVRIKTRFKLKDGFLPCIQIKGDPRYRGTEWLTTSDVWDKRLNCYCDYYFISGCKEALPSTVTMTLTEVDYKLIQEHYDLTGTEILDYCYFKTEKGIFDDYIKKYRDIKVKSTGAMRTLAKLFLNNLYGKMATYIDSSFKVAYLEDDVLCFQTIQAKEKTPGYIAIGSAITSYARNFTIRAAQKNYHGPYSPGFAYADTDSIHCNDYTEADIIAAPLHDVDFNHWKKECEWTEAIFLRQKTYLEVVNGDIDMKCAGLPSKGKQLFISSVTGKPPLDEDGNQMELTEEEQAFVNVKRTITDFKRGLSIPGKLMPVQVPGGTLLIDTTFEIK